MRRSILFGTLAVICAVSHTACSRNDQGAIAKSRAESASASPPAPSIIDQPAAKIMKPGLGGAGTATLPDGKKRPFTSIWNLHKQPRVETVIGPSGGGEHELPIIKFQEVVLLGQTSHDLKERTIRLDELYCISFGPAKIEHRETELGTKWELPYCDVELESIDGKKERFPCKLNSSDLALSVQYADGIGKERLAGSQLGGMTFQAK